MGEKRQVADNPLSRNIAKLVGFYNDPIEARRIIEKIEKETKISDGTIYSWIKVDPKKNDSKIPARFPTIDNLRDFAKFFKIKDPWDLYNKNLVVIHKQNIIDLDSIDNDKRNLIDIILDFNKKQTKSLKLYLKLYLQEKENQGKLELLKIQKLTNLIDEH